jgi:polyisoprenoid-binding protein YceI
MNSSTATFVGTVSGNAISNVKLVIAAKNLKSEKGSMMNNKAYKALKADEQPNITFTAASLPVGKTNVNGRLTIAGVTKTISSL